MDVLTIRLCIPERILPRKRDRYQYASWKVWQLISNQVQASWYWLGIFFRDWVVSNTPTASVVHEHESLFGSSFHPGCRSCCLFREISICKNIVANGQLSILTRGWQNHLPAIILKHVCQPQIGFAWLWILNVHIADVTVPSIIPSIHLGLFKSTAKYPQDLWKQQILLIDAIDEEHIDLQGVLSPCSDLLPVAFGDVKYVKFFAICVKRQYVRKYLRQPHTCWSRNLRKNLNMSHIQEKSDVVLLWLYDWLASKACLRRLASVPWQRN